MSDAVAAAIDQHYRAVVGTTTRTKGMFQADTLADLAELIGFIPASWVCVRWFGTRVGGNDHGHVG